MQHYILSPQEEQEQLARQAIINATEGHRQFGKLLKRVYGSDEHLIVERDGYPVAVIMSYQEYEQYQRLDAQKAHQDLVKKVSAEAEKQGLTEEQLLKEIKQSRPEVFRDTYGDLSSK